MTTIVLHNGRSASYIAASLIKRMSPDTIIIDTIAAIAKRHQQVSGYWTDKNVIIVGDIPPLRIIRDCLKAAQSIVYVGGERGNHSKYFQTAHPNATFNDLAEANIIINAMSYIQRVMGVVTPDADAAVIKALTNKEPFTDTDKSNVFRAIAYYPQTSDTLEQLLRMTTPDIAGLCIAGQLIDSQQQLFIQQTIETELRSTVIAGVELPCVGTNKRYCSLFASSIAALTTVGCAFYDVAEYRHFEIRDPNTTLPKEFLDTLRKQYNANGSRREMRFRIPRPDTLLIV
jgi:hypothetical protein